MLCWDTTAAAYCENYLLAFSAQLEHCVKFATSLIGVLLADAEAQDGLAPAITSAPAAGADFKHEAPVAAEGSSEPDGAVAEEAQAAPSPAKSPGSLSSIAGAAVDAKPFVPAAAAEAAGRCAPGAEVVGADALQACESTLS